MSKFVYTYSDPSTPNISGDTPYGIYDDDVTFASESVSVCKYVARRLGHPVMQLEFISGSIYSMFEEAVSEYGAQVNQFNIRDNLFHLKGQPTSSNFTHRRVKPTLSENIFISEEYGSLASVIIANPVAFP